VCITTHHSPHTTPISLLSLRLCTTYYLTPQSINQSSYNHLSVMSSAKFALDSALRAAVHVSSSKLPTEVAKSSTALFSALSGGGGSSSSTSFTLPDLSYDYNALEPAISSETMTIHHTKHHQTYVTNLNMTMEKMDAAVSAGDVSACIALQGALRFNGGGHINHALFWENLTPTSTSITTGGGLDKAIMARFGSKESLMDEMSAKTIAIQGSGWGWLVYDPKSKMIDIATLPNQDPLEATTGLKPLLGIDVWEHGTFYERMWLVLLYENWTGSLSWFPSLPVMRPTCCAYAGNHVVDNSSYLFESE
jgi:Fe-Mn family superoxide dismutase